MTQRTKNLPAILSAEKKITFRLDLRLLATENTEKILEDVFRREYNALREGLFVLMLCRCAFRYSPLALQV